MLDMKNFEVPRNILGKCTSSDQFKLQTGRWAERLDHQPESFSSLP